MTPIIQSLDQISERYSILFCDLWGCLHNGVEAYANALKALAQFRKSGGGVMLLTNAPRPAADVAQHLRGLGVDESYYDGITSSGDAAQAALFSGLYGTRVHHVGPERDMSFFTNVSEDIPQSVSIELVGIEDAESIVCTGLFDDTVETPDDYRALILRGVSQGLKMLCVNPDVIVDRGTQRIYCAGAIAKAYSEAGGDSQYCGKPWAPIYELAARRVATWGPNFDTDRILCVGDGVSTDIMGGIGEGHDTLFVTGGLAAEELGLDPEQPEPALLDPYLNRARVRPTAAIGRLR